MYHNIKMFTYHVMKYYHNIKSLAQHIMDFSYYTIKSSQYIIQMLKYIMRTMHHIIISEQDIMMMVNHMFLFLTIRQLWRSIGGLELVLQAKPHFPPSFCSGKQHLNGCLVLVVNLRLVNKSSRINKLIMITSKMNQKRGHRYNKLTEQKKNTS